MEEVSRIRNFCIIAHIDHGKSTLADRFIERCGGLSRREMSEQVLDSLDIERERGITIKAQSVTLNYLAQNGITYQLNLIDTPGHVDFAYEVSRSLAACEGALLVVDASQGVEAQTLAVCYNAIEQGLQVIPVLNKMDLPQSDAERTIQEIEELIGIDAHHALQVSAKIGQGIDELLEAVVHQIPAPAGNKDASLRALIIDSWFDSYMGVVSLVCVKQGTLHRGDKVLMMSTHKVHEVDHLGVFTPKRTERDLLSAGEVGFLVASIKEIDGAPVGDTITSIKDPAIEPLPGFKKIKPQVYAGLYPIQTDEFEAFREALAKLRLNDASLHYEPETSVGLGFGFRCGFLGTLHMEIVQQRLEREYGLNLLTTAPTVVYEVINRLGETVYVDNPAKLPPPQDIVEIREPMVEVNILVPPEFVGNMINLCIEKRGTQIKMLYARHHVSLVYEIPMGEVIIDFFDRLKSLSRGFGSLDYSFKRFQTSDLVKLDILLNTERVDAFSFIVHRSRAFSMGRSITQKLRGLIPRQMYDVAVQASIGAHVIARETIKALRKNVTAKCYGGDVTRKRKLLEKQKEGKKRMKRFGSVEVPQEVFWEIFKRDEE